MALGNAFHLWRAKLTAHLLEKGVDRDLEKEQELIGIIGNMLPEAERLQLGRICALHLMNPGFDLKPLLLKAKVNGSTVDDRIGIEKRIMITTDWKAATEWGDKSVYIRGIPDLYWVEGTFGTVVDYKVGKQTSLDIVNRFQVKTYAAMLFAMFDFLTDVIMVIDHAGIAQIATRETMTRDEYHDFQKDIERLTGEIEERPEVKSNPFKPKRSTLCDVCSFKATCPAYRQTRGFRYLGNI